jgi:hypothetical protein
MYFPFGLFACCFGNRKCKGENYNLRFRLISSVNGADLVFGPSSYINKDSIKVYSIDGTDTIKHLYGAGPNPNPGNDSLLFVTVDYRKYVIIFFRLNAADTDTLQVKYVLAEGSTCCPDYTAVNAVTYNNSTLEFNYQSGAAILKK